MMRVSKSDLQKQLEVACGLMGKSTQTMTKEKLPSGSWGFNVGAWSLDHNSHYGGIRI